MIQIHVHWIWLFKLIKEVGYHKYCWDANLTNKVMHYEGIRVEGTHTHKPDYGLDNVTLIRVFTCILHVLLYGKQSEKE